MGHGVCHTIEMMKYVFFLHFIKLIYDEIHFFVAKMSCFLM